MKLLKEYVHNIESPSFAARVNLASGFRIFRDMLANSPEVSDFIAFLRNNPDGITMLLEQRIPQLYTADYDPAFAHSQDTAIAAYLYVLSHFKDVLPQDLIQTLATDENLWWARKIAEQIITGQRENSPL